MKSITLFLSDKVLIVFMQQIPVKIKSQNANNGWFISSRICYALKGLKGNIDWRWKTCLCPVLQIRSRTSLFQSIVSSSYWFQHRQCLQHVLAVNTFFLQKILSLPKSYSLLHSSSGGALIYLLSSSILAQLQLQGWDNLQLPRSPVELCCTKEASLYFESLDKVELWNR